MVTVSAGVFRDANQDALDHYNEELDATLSVEGPLTEDQIHRVIELDMLSRRARKNVEKYSRIASFTVEEALAYHQLEAAETFITILGAGAFQRTRLSPNPFSRRTPPEPIERHHSDPKFMGGNPKQPLTAMPKSEHQQLHRDLNTHLRGVQNNRGQHMLLQKYNSGARIRANFTREDRLNALADFYRGVGSRYSSAARDFFNQHQGY